MVGSGSRGVGAPSSLLLVSFEQFGYHIDSYQYCRHLRESYRITYLCPDQGLKRKSLSGVRVVYSEDPPLGKIELGLVRDTHALLGREHFDIVFLRRSRFAWLLRLLHSETPMIFDVRTGNIEEAGWRRGLENALVPCNAAFFDNVTVISTGVARHLHLPRRAHVLPLGADPPATLAPPCRDSLKLLYVGTFTNRHLDRTVEGFASFIANRDESFQATYTIIGFGSAEDKRRIQQAASQGGVADRVKLLDRVDHDELGAVFATHNVGVAFTPRVPAFEHQPSTKLFEYLQNGLLCIATDNAANRESISEDNGVLVDDTSAGFCSGLESITARLPTWRPEKVAETVKDSTWERIVRENLEPYLDEVCRRRRRR